MEYGGWSHGTKDAGIIEAAQKGKKDPFSDRRREAGVTATVVESL
jgi:hypothetical protein